MGPTDSSRAPGLFITFEGGDGVGKSTQLKRIAEHYRAGGRNVLETREPGGSPGAERIRELLVVGDADRWLPISEALMMYAARAEHLHKTIKPALARGDIVLCDRFADSTMAYQGYAGAVDKDAIRQLYSMVVGEDGPDLTIVLHAEKALERSRGGEKNEHRFEDKGAAYQAAVTAAFHAIAADEPDRCVLIDASHEIASVSATIIEEIDRRFGARLQPAGQGSR